MVFDEEQQHVIRLRRGYWLVLAPPGCGKTEILAARVQQALEQGVDPQQMMCLTFTNRASRGMRDRIAQTLGADADVMPFTGNLHSLCSRLLFDYQVLKPHTVVIDETDSADLILDCSRRLKLPLGRQRKAFVSDIVRMQHALFQIAHQHPLSLQTSRDALSASDMEQLCALLGFSGDEAGWLQLYEQSETLWRQHADHGWAAPWLWLARLAVAHWYQCYKEQHRLIDFEDLLVMAYDALIHQPLCFPRFSWIQIDEVQDLNALQFAIVDMLTQPTDDMVVLYLGDEQQAIFSFMGAQLRTLDWLRQRCGEHVLHLTTNYRSPQYLQQVLNTYADQVLGADPALLPVAQRKEHATPGDLVLHYPATTRSAYHDVVTLLNQWPLDSRTAILVNNNDEAEQMSAILSDSGIANFKISGVDLFVTPPLQLLLSHLQVVQSSEKLSAWSRLMYRLNLKNSYSDASDWVEQMRHSGLYPTDLLEGDADKSYLHRYVQACHGVTIVFDTETTGTDVYSDDIVQIAAFRLYDGRFSGRDEDRLNLLIHTERTIPLRLGDVDNPILPAYQHAEQEGSLLTPAMALRQFLRFANHQPLVGHNVDFDYHILQFNLQRYCPDVVLTDELPVTFDTLRMARLLYPAAPTYRLASLIEYLHLEGQNSHLADDDAYATISLAAHCCRQAAEQYEAQRRFFADNQSLIQTFVSRYAALYHACAERKYHYVDDGTTLLTDLLDYSYVTLLREHRLDAVDKYPYLIRYLHDNFASRRHDHTLQQQLDAAMPLLITLREADLCSTLTDGERCFVSTVHKAKGLAFDNVIVMSVVDGVYPFYANRNYPDRHAHDLEDARKLYVALSRSRRRLVLMCPQRQYSRSRQSGQLFCRELKPSPFIDCIASYFDKSENNNDYYGEATIFEQEQNNRRPAVSCYRLCVDRCDDRYLYGRVDDGDANEMVAVAYTEPNDYGDWRYLRQLVRAGAVVNVVRPRRTTLSTDEGTPVLSFDVLIYEPDFLLDVTQLAQCMYDFCADSQLYWLNKFIAAGTNAYFLLGNIASRVLEDVALGHPATADAYLADAFHNDPMGYTLTSLSPDYSQDAMCHAITQQLDNISAVFTTTLATHPAYRRGEAILEPAFLCSMLGINGRMDYLQSDFRLLIEQKSGKQNYPDGPKPEHQVQLLLYHAILHFNYNIPPQAVDACMLYSKYPDGLIPCDYDPAFLGQALSIRNVIVERERRMSLPSGTDFMDTFTVNKLRVKSDRQQFFDRYKAREYESLLVPIHNASPLERSYFKRFYRFQQREQWLERMGDDAGFHHGVRALWTLTAAEKRNEGDLLDDLCIVDLLNADQQSVLHRQDTEGVSPVVYVLLRAAQQPVVNDAHAYTDEDAVVSNFRQGDTVILYGYLPFSAFHSSQSQVGQLRADQPCRTIVFNSTIVHLDATSVRVRLNAPQSCYRLFLRTNPHYRWAVEPYATAAGNATYVALHRFLTIDAHRRQWILNQAQPVVDDTYALRGDYGAMNALVLRAMQNRDYCLVMGPPGTGKTSVALMNILNEELLQPGATVLLCAYTNQAVDEICSKLLSARLPFIRLGHEAKCAPAYHPYLLGWQLADCDTPQAVRQRLEHTRIFVATVCTAGRSTLFRLCHFTLAIVDEASQLLEPQLLPLLTAQRDGSMAIDRFVLIGDHRQLAAVVHQSADESAIAPDDLLRRQGFVNCRDSLFERLYRQWGDDSAHTFMLTTQGRMHEELQRFPSHWFYNDKLRTLSERQGQPLSTAVDTTSPLATLLSSRRLLFLPVQPEATEAYAASDNTNPAEAHLIAQVLQWLFRAAGSAFRADVSIGVIVPYRVQIRLIRDAIMQLSALTSTERTQLSAITIDTVERFQGSQRDAIVYGFTVRRPHQLTFLAENTFRDVSTGQLIDRKLNVAITRARERLILVGNPDLLRLNPLFRSLIAHVEQANKE